MHHDGDCLLAVMAGVTAPELAPDFNVCHILDVKTRKKRTIPHPVYTVSPDGKAGCAPDFRRVQDTRPGYGYCGLPDPHKDELAPKDSGIVRVDLDTGESSRRPRERAGAIGSRPWAEASASGGDNPANSATSVPARARPRIR